MPLVLTLKSGDDVYVGKEQLIIKSIVTATSFVLVHVDSKTGKRKRFNIDDTGAVEVAPKVWVSAGEKALTMIARIVIDAPKDMEILRGEKVRNPSDRYIKKMQEN